MRVAVISDAHGNFSALSAVVADLDGQAVDAVLVGGDMAQGGREPHRVVDLLIERGWPGVLGNSDEFLVQLSEGRETDEKPPPRTIEAAKRAIDLLGPERLAYLKSLPLLHVHGNMALVHATPWSIHDVVLPEAPEDDARRMLREAGAGVVAYGHIHTAYHRRVDGKLLLSAGAVAFSNDAEPRPTYSIVNLDGDGLVEVRRVGYDVEAEIAAFGLDDSSPHVRTMRNGGPFPVRA
jgi:predicted phosphodiesterase